MSFRCWRTFICLVVQDYVGWCFSEIDEILVFCSWAHKSANCRLEMISHRVLNLSIRCAGNFRTFTRVPPWHPCGTHEEEDAQDAVDFRGEAVFCAPSNRIDLELAASLVCEATGSSIADLSGRSTSVDISLVRKALATLAVNHLGHSVADVAGLLRKHPGSVSRWLKTPRSTDGHDDSLSAILETVAEIGGDPNKL